MNEFFFCNVNTTSRGGAQTVQKFANYFPSQQATNSIHWPNSLFIQSNVSLFLIRFVDTPATAQRQHANQSKTLPTAQWPLRKHENSTSG